MINISKEWKDRFRPPVQKCSDKQKQKTVWPTSFPKFLKLTTKERQLNENAMVTYRRPQTLSQSLTKYRKIAHDVEEECAQSRPCGRCSLCGNFGKYTTNMVNTTKTIKAKSGKTYTLRKSLTCADAEIYVATCRICGEHYVGQTITSFSTRWNTHRKLWNEGATNDGDRTALLTHYNTVHGGSGAQLAEVFFTLHL